MKTCPYCWEQIADSAKKCKYCAELLDLENKVIDDHGNIWKIKEHLGFLGYECEYGTENPSLLICIHKSESNIIFSPSKNKTLIYLSSQYELWLNYKDLNQKELITYLELYNKINSENNITRWYSEWQENTIINIEAYINWYNKEEFISYIALYQAEISENMRSFMDLVKDIENA